MKDWDSLSRYYRSYKKRSQLSAQIYLYGEADRGVTVDVDWWRESKCGYWFPQGEYISYHGYDMYRIATVDESVMENEVNSRRRGKYRASITFSIRFITNGSGKPDAVWEGNSGPSIRDNPRKHRKHAHFAYSLPSSHGWTWRAAQNQGNRTGTWSSKPKVISDFRKPQRSGLLCQDGSHLPIVALMSFSPAS